MRRLIFFSVLVIAGSLVMPIKTHAQVEWISTTNSQPWVKNQIKLIKSSNSEIDASILPEMEGQIVDGFGACFNELGWTAFIQYLYD